MSLRKQKPFLILFLAFIYNLNVKAQNLCDGHEKPIGGVPEELYRGRLKKDNALYGNPYTMIDRTKYSIANDGFIAMVK